MLIKTLLTLQATQTGFDMHRVLAINMPVMSYGKTPDQIINFHRETVRRIKELPGVDEVAVGTTVPWRDAGGFGPGFAYTGEGHVKGLMKRTRWRSSAWFRQDFSVRSACLSSKVGTSTIVTAAAASL